MQLNKTLPTLLGALCLVSTVAEARGPRRPIELSGDAETIELARRYIAAYQALDVEKLASFYAEDVRFIDPTSENTPLAQPFIFEGREAVLSAIERTSQAFVCVRYDVRRIYESSGHVVFAGDSQGLISVDQGVFTGDGTIVTIITVRDGKVVEHRDYYDYPGVVFRERTRKVDRVARRVCRQGPGLPHED